MISPLSLQLQFQTVSNVESLKENDDNVLIMNNNDIVPNQIKIIMKDNTEVILDNWSSEDDEISSVLPIVIDLEQVSAININGTRIELSD